jgi:hypothetical protein
MEKTNGALCHFKHHRDENHYDAKLVVITEVNNDTHNGTNHEDDVEKIAQLEELILLF